MADKPFDFVGGSYTSLNSTLDAQRCINLYVETDETGKGKNRAALVGTPGISSFCTLPTGPIRGMLATDASRLFVVSGAKFYEIHSDGGYTLRGDVGADDGAPVYIFTNLGTQIMIVAGGKVYIDDGITVTQSSYQNGTGFVTASGTAVTWVSGSKFDSSNVGQPIVIGGTTYTVASVTDDEHLVLTSSAGSVPGTTVTGTVDVTGTAVTRASGTYFNPNYLTDDGGVGGKCTIDGTAYKIATVPDGSNLTIVSPGVNAPLTGVTFSVLYGVAYSASYPVTATCGAFLDGYFIIGKDRQVNISSPNDGKAWNPIDFGLKEGAADGIQAMLVDHQELWIFGDQTIEVWQDTGAATFPLQRNPSGFIPYGTGARGSPCRVGDRVGWLGSDNRGDLVAYLAAGFIPQRVSTYAVEAAWSAMRYVADARSYSYVEDGHVFWVISFPDAGQTWVYDVTEKVWHERASWDATGGGGGTGTLVMHPGVHHAFIPTLETLGVYNWGIHVLGDFTMGKLYVMGLDLADDDGVPIHRIRAAPHIANGTHYSYFSEFILDIQRGSGGTNLSLEYSDDGGNTWSTPRLATAVDARAVWRRLGRSRDRVFRVSYSGAGTVCWINAHLESFAGRT